MKKIIVPLVLFLTIFSCKSQDNPTAFSQEALNDTFTTLEGNSVAFSDIEVCQKLKNYKKNIQT